MFVVVLSQAGKEIILKDQDGNPIIHQTIEEAEKAIDEEIDKFVDELCEEIGKSSQNEDEV